VQGAHWSDIWPLSFKASIDELLGEPKVDTLAADLNLGIEVLRMSEIVDASLKQNGKKIDNIVLTKENAKDKTHWITLSSDAQINHKSLI